MQLLFLVPRLIAQQPRHVPPVHDEPLRFFETPASIIIYIVLPALVVVLYFIWRHTLNKKRNEKKEE